MSRPKINCIPNNPSLKIIHIIINLYNYSCSPDICCHSSLWHANNRFTGSTETQEEKGPFVAPEAVP